ncbi:hypothetical protein M1P97_25800 [Parabacteroides sp. GYB001]|uniref:DUF7666 domain-containing protein n=1 Tax=Parabacteroides leei TaxID=2939491 RepID=UPI0020170320|nr:hypothetical protein [Parabacteroides leei]MCL3854705.1 hypothetical protein [Parabacteroides leei]
MDKIKGYKGFNKNLQCRGFQYETGKEYEEKEAIKACSNGFHFCENPFDVFSYYPPCDKNGENRYCEVEASGNIDKEAKGDSKVASSKLKIKAEIGLNGIIKAGIGFILEKIDWRNNSSENSGYRSAATNTGDQSAATNTGDQSAATNIGYRSAATNTGDQSAATNIGYRSAATNTGDQSAATNTGNRSAATNTGDQSAATNTGNQSAATNTGDQSAATNTGDRSAATNTGDRSAATNTGDQSAATNTGYQSAAIVKGKESIAIVTGYKSKAQGCIGNWLVLTERGEWNGEGYPIKDVKTVKVDGNIIKENTSYMLINGKIEEVE